MSVCIYLIEQEFEGSKYGGEICARSFAEARDLAARFGAKVLGISEEQSCANCGEVLRSGSRILGDNEWPDLLNA